MALNAEFSNVDSIRAFLCNRLDELQRRSGDELSIAWFERLRLLLHALPLDTAEFGLALNRLANARHYLESAECGAARYEMRLLRRSLEHY
jgi:hypothetical protein